MRTHIPRTIKSTCNFGADFLDYGESAKTPSDAASNMETSRPTHSKSRHFG